MKHIIDEGIIREHLTQAIKHDKLRIREILQKALTLTGLNFTDVTTLMGVDDTTLLEEIFEAAREIKKRIYGNRLVLFAPLYVSNICQNECHYCAFRVSNRALERCMLTQSQIANETKQLLNVGQKRILLVSGEASNIDYILQSIETIYHVNQGPNRIRRINVNIAPLSLPEFSRLKEMGIGTYQLFQETYHLKTYQSVHLKGPKANYFKRLHALDLAMQAGIDDLGIGVLFGLYDWRFELLALIQHVNHLQQTFGVGPHTISVPRIEPAFESELSKRPPSVVSDSDFKKIIAILRLAVPYTGIILSTRENACTRREVLALGVSQISAGSRTNPGGYQQTNTSTEQMSQFSLGDHRSLDEVVCDVASLGYIPSFCTACYRLNRTGHQFMELAKPGDIKYFCNINALITFQEYLEDYASNKTYQIGNALIQRELAKLSEDKRRVADNAIAKIKSGQRDVFI
jgi:2-iminoacetate synthase